MFHWSSSSIYLQMIFTVNLHTISKRINIIVSKLALLFCSEDGTNVPFFRSFVRLHFLKMCSRSFCLLSRVVEIASELWVVIWANLSRVLAFKLQFYSVIGLLLALLCHKYGSLSTGFCAETHIMGTCHVVWSRLDGGGIVSGQALYESTVEAVTDLSFYATFFLVWQIKNLPVLCIFCLYKLV